ncbi:hypothetical protein [Flavobacterium sp. N2270]|uniref:hypothetical protein n=1 Tax=Flavobacterium sp. N2270 TaxID=2986831 RepID=UPI002225294F|nr:hypothetical protein [Flavobacterium sp. N2270]
MINIKGNKLFHNNELLITVQSSIKDFLILNNVIVLILNYDDFDSDRNIFGYNLNGEFKWQISEISKLHKRNYYTSIYLSEKQDLLAYNKNGVEITINEKNGCIIMSELIR